MREDVREWNCQLFASFLCTLGAWGEGWNYEKHFHLTVESGGPTGIGIALVFCMSVVSFLGNVECHEIQQNRYRCDE